MTELWLPDTARRPTQFRKADPPKLGEKFGAWAGREDALYYLGLPGGGVLQFDLDKLTMADYRAMRTHYQVNISLSILSFLMHQLDWRIACDNKKIRDFVELNLAEMWTRLIRGISQSFWAGYSPMVLQWANHSTEPRIILEKVKDLIPEECRVNWKEVDGYAPPGHAKPKFKIYDGIKQATSPWPIPAENTLWYPLLMENGDHYGRKLLKPAFPAWFFSQLIHLFANRYFERFGEPLPIGRAPFDDEVDMGGGNYKSGREVMEMILTNIRNRAVVVLPNDINNTGAHTNTTKPTFEYEIEYLESQMRGADFERYLTRLDEEISLGLFTPVLLYRTADVGSYNLGDAHYRLFMSMLNALAGDMKEYIDHYVLDRLVDYNFGPNAARARWVPRKLGKDNPETLRAIVQSLIQGGRAKVDVTELGTALGIGVEEIEVLQEDPPAPTPDDGGKVEDPDAPGDPAPQRGDTTKRKPSDNVKKLVADRVRGQYQRAVRDGRRAEFTPDLGYRRQLAELCGSIEAVDAMQERVKAWAADAAPVVEPAVFMERFERVLDAELASL